jgi:hypothetical protein
MATFATFIFRASVIASGVRGLALVAAAVLAAGQARAAERFFAYEPADDATRAAAGGLTLEFRQHLFFTTVINVRSTEAPATADLRPASEASLGSGGLAGLIGRGANGKALYEVETGAQGAEMIRAFCPGSKRAWLAIGRLSMSAPLSVAVIGDDPAGGRARLCRSLSFTWRGEWRLPPGPGVPLRDLKQPTHGPLGG